MSAAPTNGGEYSDQHRPPHWVLHFIGDGIAAYLRDAPQRGHRVPCATWTWLCRSAAQQSRIVGFPVSEYRHTSRYPTKSPICQEGTLAKMRLYGVRDTTFVGRRTGPFVECSMSGQRRSDGLCLPHGRNKGVSRRDLRRKRTHQRVSRG